MFIIVKTGNNLSMKKFFLIFQIFIKCFLIFLVLFIWLRYVFDSLWLSLVISFCITLLVELFSTYIKRKKGYKNNLKMKEKEDAEKMFFSLSKDNNNVDFFYKLAKSRHPNLTKFKRYILINHRDGSKVALYPLLKFQQLTLDELITIYNTIKKPVDKIVITCNEYDKNILNNLKNFSCEIVILNKYETYQSLYKEYDFYPTITVTFANTKYTFKDFLSNAFNKTRTKGYLISAFALFIASFFVQYNIYYSIIASVLLIFAIISMSNKTFNKSVPKEVL